MIYSSQHRGTPNLPPLTFDAVGTNKILASRGIEVHFADEIASTMAIERWCHANAVSVAPWKVLVAGRQPQGVGNSGAWLSHELDLKFTVLIPEAESAEIARLARMSAALAVVESLKAVSGDRSLPVFVKWPNDVRVFTPTEYKKICGILTHSVFDPLACATLAAKGIYPPAGMAAVGVGIGLVPPAEDPLIQHYGREARLSAVAHDLLSLTGRVYRREDVLTEFLVRFHDRISNIASSGREIERQFFEQMAVGVDGCSVAYFVPDFMPGILQDAPSIGEGRLCRITGINQGNLVIQSVHGPLSCDVPFEQVIRIHPSGSTDC
jgi:biotin-(acetyl-CoA carboxylase) ligase